MNCRFRNEYAFNGLDPPLFWTHGRSKVTGVSLFREKWLDIQDFTKCGSVTHCGEVSLCLLDLEQY